MWIYAHFLIPQHHQHIHHYAFITVLLLNFFPTLLKINKCYVVAWPTLKIHLCIKISYACHQNNYQKIIKFVTQHLNPVEGEEKYNKRLLKIGFKLQTESLEFFNLRLENPRIMMEKQNFNP